MEMNNRTRLLFEFVKKQHEGQVRKYTGEPYWKHLENVAELVWNYTESEFLVAIALCHDLFEDTGCTEKSLYACLIHVGFARHTSLTICSGVENLTDKFTKENFPNKNREWRKDRECKRLWGIPHLFQSVKYADLIDNTKSIAHHDKEFAKVYLEEKRHILSGMRQGDKTLLAMAEQLLAKA